MKENIEYPVRMYSKSELAHAYCGYGITSSAARKWLATELSFHPELMEKLKQLGLRKKQKLLTPAMVKAIFDTIGPP